MDGFSSHLPARSGAQAPAAVGSDPVSQAFAWAGSDCHGGAGFWLVLTLRDGRVVKGSPYAPLAETIRIDVFDEESGDVLPPVWVRLSEVATCTVEW